MTAVEVNFDGLVGPTHNYAGLAFGNLAATRNARQQSNPRLAALQGLGKMRALQKLGLTQAILPPHERPAMWIFRELGFAGDDAAVLDAVWKRSPGLLMAASSAAAMWTANAATVSPSADCADGRLHLTPANLVSNFHRSIEHPVTGRALRAIFPDQALFAHHDALRPAPGLGDEGAANHTRLCPDYGAPGVEIFVYGRTAFATGSGQPKKFPARQTLEASQAIARRHGLAPERCVFARQNPAAIDKGVFHNDVIAVGNRNVLFYHQQAFAEPETVLAQIRAAAGDMEVEFIEVPASAVGIDEAVGTYLFNSQLVSPPDSDGMTLVVPAETRRSRAGKNYLKSLEARNGAIRRIEVMDVRQSMDNGGGPACLRLRVVLTKAQMKASNKGVFLTDRLATALEKWIHRHYRDRLTLGDLRDPLLLDESRQALDELSTLLALASIYDFQRG